MIPILINVRDYGSPAMLMVEHLRRIPEARPIIVDNASTWVPWVEWLDRAPCEVIRLSENRGPRAPLTVLPMLQGAGDVYCITDGDLDLSGVPLDVLQVLRAVLDDWPHIAKVGLSLEINDLPGGYPFNERAVGHESQFWRTSRDLLGRKPLFWEAEIDTTFCMMRTRDPYPAYGPAVRADHPYTARHLPWYVTPETATPEYEHYLANAGFASGIYWTTLLNDSRKART